jgi:hypothetical protein
MSRKIPATRRSVTPSCSRIDIQPSVRAATLVGGWLFVVCVVVLASVALPLPARIGICLGIATPALAALRTSVLLRGGLAVQGLQWSGGWQACIGPDRIQTPVTLRAGSFRVGRAFLLLWLESCDGIHGVFIDVGRQDPRAIRSLCRQLIPSNPKV